MRRFQPSFPFLLIFLIAPALLVFGHSSGLLRATEPKAAASVEIPDTATEAFAQGVERFEEQRYAEAVELLEAAADLPGNLDQRALTFYREAAKLRLAAVRNDGETQRLSKLALQTMAEQSMDDWGAHAVREMIRGGFGADGDVVRLLGHALERWEQSADVLAATREYVDVYRTLLDPARRWQSVQAPLLRMWENLVSVEAPPEDLLEIGSLILEGRPVATPMPVLRDNRGRDMHRPRVYPPSGGGFDSAQLVRRVANDILAMDPPGWLAASAHFQLGEQAESAGRYREAQKRYEAAIAATGPADSWAVKDAQARLEELVKPRLDISGDRLYRPGSHHALQVNWRNLGSWTIQLRRIDPYEDWTFPNERRQSRNSLHDFLRADAGTRVSQVSREDEDELASRQLDEESEVPEPHMPRGDLVWLDPLEPGVYLAVLSGSAIDAGRSVAPARFAFQVTDLGLTFQRVDAEASPEGNLELWLVDMATGAPIADASLVLHSATREGNFLTWSSTPATTDTDGLARTALPDSRIHGSLVTGEAAGRPVVLLNFRAPTRPGLGDAWRGFVLTDRPLYRPGETVHLQAFLRQRDVKQRQSVVPAMRDVEVIITAPDGSEFLRQPFTLDDNGALETALDLPERPALGRYNVQIRVPAKDRWIGGGSFQVDEYRLPEFVVRAGLDAEKRYVAGDTLQVEVEAEYLFGGPVGGTAEVVVTRQPLWIMYHPWVRFDWLREEKISPYPHWGYGGEEILRVTQPLDAEGRLVLSVPTAPRESSPQDYTYTIEARVTDSSRREETGSATARVTRQELYAYLTPRRHVVAPGDEASLRLRVQDAMDRPAEIAGRWTVSRQDKEGSTKELFARNTQTGADGEVLLDFTPAEAGYYHIHFATQDTRGVEVTAATTVWCADPKTTRITHTAGALQLISEKDEFIEDDVARVLLVSDTAGAPVYLSRHFAGQVETQVLRMKGTVQLLEIPLDRLHRPYFYLQAVRARDFLLHQATTRVVAPLGEQALDVTVTFDRESYEPGDTADLRIRALDALGRPVATPLTIAVVDEAVLAILPRQLSDPSQTFNRYDTPRPRDLQLSASGFGGFRQREEPKDDARDELGYVGGRLDSLAPTEPMSRMRQAAGNESPASMRLEAEESMVMADADASSQFKSSGRMAPAPPEGSAAPATVRTDFRTTALWRTAVMTDADGTATVEVPLAQSLTQWEALAVAMTPESKAGLGTGQTRTRKDVMVRLNHPRVFREMDRFLFAATVHNETDEDLGCRVSLEAEGLTVEGDSQTITVAAHGQAQVEWWATIPSGSAGLDFAFDDQSKRVLVAPSQVLVKVTAQTRLDSDAFERNVKLLPHGTDLRVVAAAEVKPGTKNLRFTLPSDRLLAAEMATLTLSPSVLSACIDALPFLAEYPYGCTEQTLSRFVPAVAVRHAVAGLGVSSARIDPELDAKIEKGLRRIGDFQHGDGGWGWWKEDESSPYMTAHVLIALSRAKASDVSVDSGMLRRGREAMRTMLPKLEPRPDDMAYSLFALSCVDRALRPADTIAEDEAMQRFSERLFAQRDRLRDYSRALLATYLHRAAHSEKALLTLQNLENTAQLDTEYDTVHWGRLRGYWWRGEGAVETTAFALAAYGEIAPEHPNTRRAARWLVTNREGARWNNTRATAHVIYALVDFARDSQELAAEYVLVATVDGHEIARLEVDAETIVDGGGEFEVPTELLHDGANEVQLHLEGQGICYATISVQTYTRAENPEPTKHYLGVRREVVRLRPLRTLGGSILQIEEPLKDGEAVESGDRIRVRLHLEAHNDLEYLAIEDPRPAGCEPTDQLSGWFWGQGVGGRREIRDELTAFFVGALSQGDHVLEYELRAESPGVYHVMPTRAYAMYVPDVNGSSAEFHLEITRSQQSEGKSGAR